MRTRNTFAAQFYPGNCKANIEELIKGFKAPREPKRVVAGIVPHAGWFFSGSTAAKVFMAIRARRSPSTFIIFGAVHVPTVRSAALYPEGAWDTPLGPVQIDAGLAGLLLKRMPSLLSAEPRAHDYEHSIEVQVPFIKYLFPDAKILPVAVPFDKSAVKLGERVGKLIEKEGADAVVIGSTDLTHYGENYGYAPAGYGSGGYDWMRENDGRIIGLAKKMAAEAIMAEAAENHNACGPGAMAATIAAARAMGAGKGFLLNYTTSYDVFPDGDFNMAVGYAGMVF